MDDKRSGDEGIMPDWSTLAPEILTNVLSRLTIDQRWTGAMFVCKSWLTACKDPCLFSVFNLEPIFESSIESDLWWSRDFERMIDSMFRSVVGWSDGNLSEIRVRHCTDSSLSYAAERCPNLRVLSIKKCPNVTDASMTKIAFRCTKLVELDISYSHEISHESLIMIGRNCPNLKILKRNMMNWVDPSKCSETFPTEYLHAYPQDGDSEANAIGKHMPNLKHLEIQFSKLSARGLSLICDGCENLELLDLSGCVHLMNRDIDSATSNMKNLKEIKKPELYVRRSETVPQTDRYGHWRLYDDRFDVAGLRF